MRPPSTYRGSGYRGPSRRECLRRGGSAPTGGNGEVWPRPCREAARRVCGYLSSAGRAPPVYQGAGGARSGKPLGMLRAEGGRAVHHPMMRGALSRRAKSRRREKSEEREAQELRSWASYSLLALLGGLSLPRGSLPRACYSPPGLSWWEMAKANKCSISPGYWTSETRAERARPAGGRGFIPQYFQAGRLRQEKSLGK